MDEFTIHIGNRPAQAEQMNKTNFVVNINGKPLHLCLKQDNEGANHWFDAATNNETPQSKEAGTAIEVYQANKKE